MKQDYSSNPKKLKAVTSLISDEIHFKDIQKELYSSKKMCKLQGYCQKHQETALREIMHIQKLQYYKENVEASRMIAIAQRKFELSQWDHSGFQWNCIVLTNLLRYLSMPTQTNCKCSQDYCTNSDPQESPQNAQ